MCKIKKNKLDFDFRVIESALEKYLKKMIIFIDFTLKPTWIFALIGEHFCSQSASVFFQMVK